MGKEEDIVLKVYMHCKGCSEKVYTCLKGILGIEEINVDMANNEVILKGKKVDPMEVLKRMQKRYSRNVQLLSPRPEPETTDRNKNEPAKKPQPEVKTVVLRMNMHCEGCAEDAKTYLESMKGIIGAEADMGKSQITVRGVLEESELVKTLTRRLGKHVEVVKQEPPPKPILKEEKKCSKKKETIIINYPPINSYNYIHPSQIFSDENVNSCSIM
ncbi:hypothetical protein K2173_009852 [Erythroxylum novogranatense]|uniref:HMA domain-containing protein n=1 Tax=Erythroxylum novogranatense TaxID=1862640 RepID=A0AAV8T018_9ROSI|nr:hypothetical protein K2173_009852 [Erythroxylum novogranatense]